MSRKVATVTKQFFLLITTHRRLEKQKKSGIRLVGLCDQFARSHWRCSKNDQNSGWGSSAVMHNITKCAKNREYVCENNSGFRFFASLSSSHDFLSVIFGILRKFRIGIGLRNFCGRKIFRRKNMINNFDRKKIGRENFWSKIFEILKISKIQIFENFGISKFSKSQKFSTKKNLDQKFSIKIFDHIFSTKNFPTTKIS